MTDQTIKTAIIDSLQSVAPEVDPASLDPQADLREQCDLDSMDFLNFVIGLHERLGIDIPEIDYPKMRSFAKATDYLSKRKA